jgi:hypothetical protein
MWNKLLAREAPVCIEAIATSNSRTGSKYEPCWTLRGPDIVLPAQLLA